MHQFSQPKLKMRMIVASLLIHDLRKSLMFTQIHRAISNPLYPFFTPNVTYKQLLKELQDNDDGWFYLIPYPTTTVIDEKCFVVLNLNKHPLNNMLEQFRLVQSLTKRKANPEVYNHFRKTQRKFYHAGATPRLMGFEEAFGYITDGYQRPDLRTCPPFVYY